MEHDKELNAIYVLSANQTDKVWFNAPGITNYYYLRIIYLHFINELIF